jgi:hypothetical protein
MLTAVWVAVVAAAAAFVIGAGVAVCVMLKAARLMSQASAAVAGLRARGDLLIDRANGTIDAAGEQIARTQTVTTSLEGVTAAMAELGGQVAAAASVLPEPGATRGPLTWAAALVYGVRWALGTHRPPADEAPAHARPWPGREAGRRAVLASRGNGTPR